MKFACSTISNGRPERVEVTREIERRKKEQAEADRRSQLEQAEESAVAAR